MLEMTFYSHEKDTVEVVEFSEEFYEWLIKSDFSKIGKSEEKEMKGDEEVVKIPVVVLEGKNRRKFSDFFRDAIVQASDDMLSKLGNSPSKQEYLEASYSLKMLQELRKFIEDEKIKYLSR